MNEMGAGVSGAILVDKPSGPTSFDVVRAVRRAVGIRRAGHTGTLDPLASGLLVVCIGRATRLAAYLLAADKEYVATVRLGVETDTLDAEGRVTVRRDVDTIDSASLDAVLRRFVGRIRQRPPAHSAIKRDGVPLYRRARRGETVDPPERDVRIDALELLRREPESLELRIRCGKGTYIRSLARDIGAALGCGAHVEALRRTRTGGLDVAEAQSLPEIEAGRARMVPAARLVAHLPSLIVGEDAETSLRHGRAIGTEPIADFATPQARVRVHDRSGRLVAIATASSDGRILRPERVIAVE